MRAGFGSSLRKSNPALTWFDDELKLRWHFKDEQVRCPPPHTHISVITPPPIFFLPAVAGGALDEVAPASSSLHWMLPPPPPPPLVLPLASVPLVSEDRALFSEFRLASEGRASRRGGILSLMRSKPLASSKLVILCWGEKPLMAVEMQESGRERKKKKLSDGGRRRVGCRNRAAQLWSLRSSVARFPVTPAFPPAGSGVVIKQDFGITRSSRGFANESWKKSTVEDHEDQSQVAQEYRRSHCWHQIWLFFGSL